MVPTIRALVFTTVSELATSMWKPCRWKFFVLCLLVLTEVASAKDTSNIADEIADIINQNRTATKLKKLYKSPGLGCMALQFISECTANCSTDNSLHCQPPEVDITEVYAPNCGVELPTVDTITGRRVGCQWSYLTPQEALSRVLFPDNKSLALLHSMETDEVGVGYMRGRNGPFFWSILFSSGKTNSTFVLEGGTGIRQRSGCYSGMDLPCSGGTKLRFLEGLALIAFHALFYCTICLTIH